MTSSTFIRLFVLLLLSSCCSIGSLWQPLDPWSPKEPSRCPDCSRVVCLPLFTKDRCPPDSIFTDRLLWGCCPACLVYLGLNASCVAASPSDLRQEYSDPLECRPSHVPEYVKQEQSGDGLPIVWLFSCAPHLQCDQTLGTCQMPSRQEAPCFTALAEYEAWKANFKSNCSINKWQPSCNPNGFFQAVQTKSNFQLDGKFKFCFDPLGQHLFGLAKAKAEPQMNCRCSRTFWQLNRTFETAQGGRLQGRWDVTLHCSSEGNFERLQCDAGVCWCVQPQSGRVSSRVLHHHLFKRLPCYLESHMGQTYLRRCESRAYSRAKTRAKLERHNLKWGVNVAENECDLDGSFSAKYCSTGQCRCVDKMGQPIGSWVSTEDKADQMDCRCARRRLQGDLLQCTEFLGGFQELQTSFKGREFCVDQEGFTKTYVYDKGPFPCQIAGCPEREEFCSQKEGLCTDCPVNCAIEG